MTKNNSNLKVLILWTHISGYINACLKKLSEDGCEILIVAYHPDSSAPFSTDLMDWIPASHRIFINEGDNLNKENLSLIKNYEPDILICAGWSNYNFIKLAKNISEKCLKIITFDTQYLSTLRQMLGRIWFKISLLKIFKYAFVPGDRQLMAALHFGFDNKNILMGSYAPDNLSGKLPDFYSISRNKKFIFVGRLALEKGVETLIEAYVSYRAQSDNPWPLSIAGVGPLSPKLNVEGVNLLGFLTPDALFQEMRTSSCLIAPSLFEPWGVQISEGASLGLPIIATTACGASVHLVRNNFNGYLVAPGDSNGLCQAMLSISTGHDLEEFSRNSYSLSGQYTPTIWSKSIIQTYIRFNNTLEL